MNTHKPNAEQQAAIAALREALAQCEAAGLTVCHTTEHDEAHVWQTSMWGDDSDDLPTCDGLPLVVLGDNGAYDSDDVVWDDELGE